MIELKTASELREIAKKYDGSKPTWQQQLKLNEVRKRLEFAAANGCNVVNYNEPLPDIVCQMLKDKGFDVKDNGLAIYF